MNKKQQRKRRKILLCIFATFAFSTNNIPRVIYAKQNLQIEQQYYKDKKTSHLQPISPYWYPKDLLNWDVNNDMDAKFNKSTIPLAKRTDKENLYAINENQNKDTKVLAISIMNSSTSGNPTQGSNTFSSNTFSYWQYIDTLVYWGGSAGEGIIVPPSADVTDSAHRNGVPVLGTVFFPQSTHGGKLEWLNEFLQKDALGRFPLADKLIQVATIYGFDGWFINQETEGTTTEHAKLMQEFIQYFKKNAPNLQITWYDSMTNNGAMDWQNALTNKNKMFLVDDNCNSVADNMFLNFWWTNKNLADNDLLFNSNLKAEELGLNQYDLFAGIDVQANGFNTPIRWNLFQRDGKAPFTSLGLYCPSWTYFSSETPEEFEKKENRLWVNEHGNPSKITNAQDMEWKGISNFVVEKNVINKTPFISNFSMGNGTDFYVNGEKFTSQDWNNRSLQDIQPTYKWIIENEDGNSLNANLDYSTAYYGGNSISFNGNLSANKYSTIKLFSADLHLSNNLSFTTVAKSNSSEEINMDLVLEFHDGETATIKSNNTLKNNWTILTYDISPYIGKSIKTISYKVSSSTDLENAKINLGNISIQNTNSHEIVNVNNLVIEDTFFEDGIFADIRLCWKSSDISKTNTHHYEIYRLNNDGTKTFLGATPNTNFFIDNLRRNGKENCSTFEVIAINNNYKTGSSSNITIEWPDYPTPTASFEVSKTLIAPGGEVTFTNTSSETTEKIEWIFEGANIETTSESNPTVIFEEEGVYSVTLKAKNTSGESIEEKKDIITVSKSALNKISNLALDKDITASSFVNDNENPSFAIDGNNKTKWCAVGDGPHSFTIDLEKNKTISEFVIQNAEVGGEGKDYNTHSYTISLSNDGENFTPVINRIGNSSAVSKEPIKVTEARYVKFNIDKATQGGDKAARIYEFEVYGLNEKLDVPNDEENNNNNNNGSEDNNNGSEDNNNGSEDNKPGNNNDNLPNTGSPLSSSSLLFLGGLLSTIGAIVLRKKSKNN
ncbi:endo-beta-N-acetylglucosaminidase [Clostridium tarantellae]|uniref:PKD domain-containing protein n=1 Tax=Clostridium tarantellae TaxID=39493 RepID=A0A6I1MJL5_9CLOT|nr:discoidin domain-containing protein [Clostridium tarantellae]MPQ43134.1 PKD domain-containing protein [Clostridium tarantellae]